MVAEESATAVKSAVEAAKEIGGIAMDDTKVMAGKAIEDAGDTLEQVKDNVEEDTGKGYCIHAVFSLLCRS